LRHLFLALLLIDTGQCGHITLVVGLPRKLLAGDGITWVGLCPV